MMLAGEVAAAILGNDMPSDPRIRTIMQDPHWPLGIARKGTCHANDQHVRPRDLLKQRPDVVQELFRMIVESHATAPAAPFGRSPPLGVKVNPLVEMAMDGI